MTLFPPPPERPRVFFLAFVSDDTFSIEAEDGGVSLVDRATLKRLLNQRLEGTNEYRLGGKALG